MGEEKRQASDRPQRGRGRPAGCRGAFEGRARGCLVAFGSGPSCGLQKRLRAGPVGEEKRQASDRPQRGRGRPAGCREAFEGGARGCLTLPSEAHRKSFVGQAAGCREACNVAIGSPQKKLCGPRAGPVGEEKRQVRTGFGQATERPGQACRLPRSV